MHRELVDEAGRRRVNEAVAVAESHTAAELLPVVAARVGPLSAGG